MSSLGLNIRIPKQSLIRLKELEHKQIVVKFAGGRVVYGELKSWDKTMNLILNNTHEVLGVEDKTESTRQLGLIIVKGSQIQSISLKDGYVIIDNPFANEEEEDQQQEQPEESEEKQSQQQQQQQENKQ